MPRRVKIEETVELPHPRAAVWPILAKTDWINRAVGLPPVNYEVRPLPEGGSEVIAHARLLGIPLVWQEFPFEWTEPEFYQVRRIFSSGPFAEGVMGLRLRESPAGCRIEIFAHFLARNIAGTVLARNVIGPKTMRDMRALIRHVGENLSGREPVVMPRLPRATANAITLESGLAKLRAEKMPPELVEQLRRLLTDSPDVELSHLRPFAVAKRWQTDRWEVLRLFLHATRAGLLNLRWEVLCPNCRSTRLPRKATLSELAHTAH